jgi:hypothetical protein
MNAGFEAFRGKGRYGKNGAWRDQRWASFGVELLESYAWRAASGPTRKVIDRIVVEHLLHGSLEDGNLKVTYNDFELYGIRRQMVRSALEEAVKLGLIGIVDPGAKAWGGFKGKPARYRITWFGTRDGASPSMLDPRICLGRAPKRHFSIIRLTPDGALKASVSCESIDAPAAWPTTLRLAPMSCSGETWIGWASTPTTISRPRTASPSITGVIAAALVTVASTVRAPPRRLSAAATSSADTAIRCVANYRNFGSG